MASETGNFDAVKVTFATQRIERDQNVVCIQVLVEHAADPDADDSEGNTPLHLASDVDGRKTEIEEVNPSSRSLDARQRRFFRHSSVTERMSMQWTGRAGRRCT